MKGISINKIKGNCFRRCMTENISKIFFRYSDKYGAQIHTPYNIQLRPEKFSIILHNYKCSFLIHENLNQKYMKSHYVDYITFFRHKVTEVDCSGNRVRR